MGSKQTLGTVLRQARKRKGRELGRKLILEDVRDATRISVTTLHRYENDVVPPRRLTVYNLLQLTRFYGIDFDDVVARFIDS